MIETKEKLYGMLMYIKIADKVETLLLIAIPVFIFMLVDSISEGFGYGPIVEIIICYAFITKYIKLRKEKQIRNIFKETLLILTNNKFDDYHKYRQTVSKINDLYVDWCMGKLTVKIN